MPPYFSKEAADFCNQLLEKIVSLGVLISFSLQRELVVEREVSKK